jgi:hypothetical protein
MSGATQEADIVASVEAIIAAWRAVQSELNSAPS